ncbi:MAG: hypothetical protein ACU0CI_00885 [Shimia sp.]
MADTALTFGRWAPVHPALRRGPAKGLWPLGLWLAGCGAFELWVALRVETLGGVMMPALSILTGGIVIARWRWAWLPALLMSARQMFGIIVLLMAGSDAPPLGIAYGVVNGVIGIAAVWWLVEGATPNRVFLGRARIPEGAGASPGGARPPTHPALRSSDAPAPPVAGTGEGGAR